MDFLLMDNVSKVIKGKTIIENISFSIKENEIVGFIGPNGAGKSTVMKCIAGLYKKTSGKIEIMGFDNEKQHTKAMQELGISIEYPTLYANLSGYEHFKLMKSWRNVSDKRYKEVIKQSGLTDEDLKRKIGKYSMGMKQKLMLSLVMMSKPKLLILDEPTNGLDPTAVFDLRQQLLKIHKEGTAIILSSHDLSELEKIVTRVIFIKKGNIVADYKMTDLERVKYYDIKVNEMKEAIKLLQNYEIQEYEESILVELQEHQSINNILEILLHHHITIISITEKRKGLDAYYQALIQELL